MLSIPLVLAGAYAGWACWNARSLGREVERALAQVGVGEPPAPADRETTLAIEQLYAELEALAPAERGVLAPRVWDAPAFGLDDELAPLAPFFARADEVIGNERSQTALADPRHRATGSPLLLRARNAANVLGASALAAARQGQWDLAHRRLGLVYDLAYLGDDGSSVGGGMRIALEGIGNDALQRLLAIEGLDPAALRAVIEPRLERAADPRRLERTLASEIETWVLAADLPCGARDPWAWLTGACRIGEARETFTGFADLAEASAAVARGEGARYEAPLIAGISGANLLGPATGARIALHISLQSQSRHQLARTALALLVFERRQGAWPASLSELAELFPRGLPRDPLRGLPCAYDPDGSELSSGPVLGPTRIGELHQMSARQMRERFDLWSPSRGA